MASQKIQEEEEGWSSPKKPKGSVATEEQQQIPQAL